MSDVKQRVLEQLQKGVATVVFTKVNGERREMNCTLNETILPERETTTEGKPVRKSNPDVQSVWDVDKQAWRSFRWDSLAEGEN